nr:RNA-directed DNA polymerase, eukaryota [Tanacetum cinerariifolium]
MGRLKEFASLSNLKKAITNEGFVDYTIQYLGELWVMLDFVSIDSKKLFFNNLGVKSWFSSLKDASFEFMPKGRIVWMDVEGIPLKLWTHNTFKRIGAKWGVLLELDDQDNTYMHSKRTCLITKSAKKISENFNIIFHGKIYWIRANEVPGWVPDFLDDGDEDESDTNSKGGDSINNVDDSQGDVPQTEFGLEKQSNDILAAEHIGQTEPTAEDPFGLYPLINKKMSNKGEGGNSDQTPNYPPGFTPNASDNILKHQCWGNFGFDFVHGDSVGNSGGILCVWDVNSFRISSHTVLDSFVLTWGMWLKTGKELLIVSVYAPHNLKEKLLLWEYLLYVIHQWKGEVIIMGDFNEVRFKSDRFGLAFHANGANKFNSFIFNAGLKEVHLGGSAFTWCHKFATKTSKLDKFLIFENLFNTCPNITAITLERFLSNYRPILLRESHLDYGPTPFKFYHHWLEIEGFDKFVGLDKGNSNDMKSGKVKLKENLYDLDIDIDNGASSTDLVKKRSEMDLERAISKEEVKQAVWDCGSDKSLGPDGFTFGFYRHFWSTIKKDFFEAVN